MSLELKQLLGKNISTDTRTLQKGDVFFALQGPNFDGHDFVAEAATKGAAYAVVSQPVEAELPTVVVGDTYEALAELATLHREQFDLPVIGITGSCGKTTTTAMMTSVLSRAGKTLAPTGSFNNHIGLPLTVLKLNRDHKFAIFEMGANHVGEIKALAKIAQPNVTMITLVAPVHVEGFGSIENIAKAKSEIYDALPKEGVAVVNADDAFIATFKQHVGDRKMVTFGLKSKVDVTAKNIVLDDDCRAHFRLLTPSGEIDIQLPIVGEHHVMNALAATAAALAVGVTLEHIKAGLETMESISKRTQFYTAACGAKLIDDSYNASLASTTAALRILSKHPGKKILAFADMLELGELSQAHHREVAQHAKSLGIDAIYTFGPLAKITAEAFGEQGYAFDDQSDMIVALKTELDPNSALLAKGSNSMKMWQVVEALK